MKKVVFILLFLVIEVNVFSQSDTNKPLVPDTTIQPTPPRLPKPVRRRIAVDTLKRKKALDSLLAAETVVNKDTNAAPLDTVTKKATYDTNSIVNKKLIVKKPIDSFYLKLLDNPFLRTKAKPIFLVINERKRTSKDEMFYLVLGLLLFLAFIKLVFSKYFANIFRLFFQPSFRQKQTREQLQQGNLPSLLLNLFFIFSSAAYISFLLDYYHLTDAGFWNILGYSSLCLLVLYTGKYIFLSFAGWVFNVKEATDAYIFAIYLINKILGVVLIPFTLVIAFSKPYVKNISITISILLILLLFLYRYIVSYGPVRREIKSAPCTFSFTY